MDDADFAKHRAGVLEHDRRVRAHIEAVKEFTKERQEHVDRLRVAIERVERVLRAERVTGIEPA